MKHKPMKRSRKAKLDVFTLCGKYVSDNADLLEANHVRLIKGHLRARRYDLLSEIPSTIAFEYLNADSYRVIHQVAAFFKKNAAFADEELCVNNARENFFKGELICRETNERLRDSYVAEDGNPNRQLAPGVTQTLIDRMRTTISRIVGGVSDFYSQVERLCYISSGATSDRPRRRSIPYMKVSKHIPTTPRASKYLISFLSLKGFSQLDEAIKVSYCNRVTVVPKTWKTHRTIAAEPSGNLFFQLGIDGYFKRRLKTVGIDLTDQSRNQQLAQIGSKTGYLATCDLAMASDTLAYELVPYLFDDQWTNLLTDLRSPYYKGDFGYGKYEKFASMGNGFTFPVESIIFYAAARAVSGKQAVVSVYGDDIIVETGYYDDLSNLLSFLGFTVNHEKSFSAGPFRESCGADFYDGKPVRPFFIKDNGKMGKNDLCHYVNGLRRVCNPGQELWKELIRLVKVNRLPLVPVSENTQTGVHVIPEHCERQILYRRKVVDPLTGEKIVDHNQLVYNGYIEKQRTRKKSNIKTLLLWFVRKDRTPYDAVESSLVDTLQPVTRFGVLAWLGPCEGPSDYSITEWSYAVSR